MSAFDRLTSPLQYQIATTLGFSDLRPVQKMATDAILDGNNAVVLAPTAGGKTEASFFPLISMMDEHDWRPVSVLYLSPIRALLNNQEQRVQTLAGLVGRTAFKWHGDTTQSQRKKFLRNPTDILLITPESLEAMMMSARIPAAELLGHVRAIIIDEVHAFADDDRGAHLSALMERLSRFCGNDVQRIGLSATVGNPAEILSWIQGSSRRNSVLVNPPKEPSAPEIKLDFVGNIHNASAVIKALHPGKKRLVFVDSRRVAEELGKLLLQQDVDAFVIHGSLSVVQRSEAERAFHEGQDCVIVATSALELGIDVGDLDHVIQIDAPPSVASFLQRMGRTGRRAGSVPNCTFLVTKENAVLHAAAIIRLYRSGFVEPVRPPRRASHIYAHQVMALTIQTGGVNRIDIPAWLHGCTAFADLSSDETDAIIQHMTEEGILSDDQGRLWLGPDGEARFGRANFRELYAVFDVPRLVTVLWHQEEVGTVDATFLMSMYSEDQGFGSFILGGRPWQITYVDWQRGRCIVEPAPEGRAPRWSGGARYLGYELCQAMKAVLLSETIDPAWSARMIKAMESERAEYTFLDPDSDVFMEGTQETVWYNFAGGAANQLLARIIEQQLGGKCVARNASITLKEEAANSMVAVRQLLSTLRAESRPNLEDAERYVDPTTNARVSKFERCLPTELLSELVATTLFDIPSAQTVVCATAPTGK